MSTQHTPGAWRIDNRSLDEGARGTVVASVETTFGSITIRSEHSHRPMPTQAAIDAEAEANARLIAAAPDLLATVKFLLEQFDGPGLHPDQKSAIACGHAVAWAAENGKEPA